MSDPSSGRLRRYYIATGTADYPPGVEQLPSVIEDVNRVKSALTRLNYQDALPDLPLNPTRDQLDSIEAWFKSCDQQSTDEVVFYYSGHGHSDDRHYLLLGARQFPTGDLFRAVARNPTVRQVLLILDTCYSGQLTLDIGAILEPFEQRLENARCTISVVTSSRTRNQAKVHVFANALSNVLTSDDRQWGGPTQPVIGLAEVLKAIRPELPSWQRTKATVFPPTDTGESPFAFPNLRYVAGLPQGLDLEAQRIAIERKTHWDPRIEYFTGRKRVLAQIHDWLKEPNSSRRPCIVTGGPGTGKSSVLAQFVAREPGVISIHARGRTLAQLTEVLARAAAVDRPSTDLAVDDRAKAAAVTAAIRDRQSRNVIIVDALDEAVRPREIAETLLKPLAGSAHIWLLAGTRPDTVSGHAGPRYRALAPAVEIDLDDPCNLGNTDVSDYAATRLRACFLGQPDQLSKAAAHIAARAGRTFLIAKLTCDRLIADPAASWEQDGDATIAGEFRAYLRRFDNVPGWSESKAVDLLEPLAWAKGLGLPWDDVWAPLASAISGRPYTDSDVRDLLVEAAPYLVESLEAGRSVYRLFHEGLAEALRDPGRTMEIQRRFVSVLKTRDWRRAHPYSLSYLALHAAEADRLDELAVDPLFLASAQPAGLRRDLAQCQSAEARQFAAVYSIASHELDVSPAERASYLEFGAQKLNLTGIANQFAALDLKRAWSAPGAVWKLMTPHWTLAGHERSVTAVAVGQRRDRPVIVSGSRDKTVRVWDLETLEAVGAPLAGHEGAITSVAVGQRQGRPVIVSGSWDNTVRVWDLETLEALSQISLGSSVRALAFHEDGFVAATDSGIVRIKFD